MTASTAPIVVPTVGLLVVVAAFLRPRTGRILPPRDVSLLPGARRTDLTGRVTAMAGRLRRSSADTGPRAVAEWCDDLAREVRSGSTLREALATTRPGDPATCTATDPLRLGLTRGRSTGDALGSCTTAGPHLHLALRVIRTVARVGGSSPVAIDRTAAALRQRAADRDERAVQAAQARLSAHVLTAIPLLMLALLLATDADVRHAVTAPVGAACVGIGLVLNLAGWSWMRRVVRTTA